MSITTCQKVTLISCSVLCVSLFLPKIFLSRGKSEIGQPIEGKTGLIRSSSIHHHYNAPSLLLSLLLLLLLMSPDVTQ